MKKNLTDLAIFGGEPAFAETLHVGRPNVGDRQRLVARFEDILDRGWFTNHGPCVREFEERLAEMLGVEHCIAMCNATVALEIAARAVGFAGEVIVPAFTFVATAHCLQWQEITPVFCDVDPVTHNLDPEQVERMITPRTTGILGVHLWGQPCDVEALAEIALRHRLRVVYDAAHAFACSHRGRLVGGFGDVEVFSFHATKFFNTFEGGAVTTNDGDLAKKMRLMHNFGFAGLDEVIYLGMNGKMSEVSAAMGLTGLESLDEFVAANQEHHRHYREQLGDLPGVRMLAWDGKEKHNHQYVVLEIDGARAGLARNLLVEVLHAEGVRARRYFYPGCHRMEPYRSLFPHAGLLLPVTERLVDEVVTLPTGAAIGAEDVGRVCDIIRFVLSRGHEVRKRLTIEGR